MARSIIPLLPELRRNGGPREQVRGFAYLLHTIALGRRPGEQGLSRQSMLTRLLAALVMSVALWYYVTDQENPIVRSQPFTLQAEVRNIPSGLALRSPTIMVTVTARGLQDQVSSPGVIFPIIDLKGVSPNAREATVPVTISGGRSGVQYTANPATVSVSLEPLVSATVPVTFVPQSSLPLGLTNLPPRLSPSVLTISGPADQVNRVYHATVTVPLDSISPPNSQSSSFSETFNISPQLFDIQGKQISASGLLPPDTRVKVTLQINVSLAIQTLAVAPILSGGLPLGYQLDGIQVEPPSVTVVGPPDAVNSLRAITTQPVLLNGVTHSMTLTTFLDLVILPPNVAVYSQGKGTQGNRGQVGPKWSVYVSISKSKGTNALPASIRVDHLGKGLRAILGTSWLQVYVDAPYLAIAKLPPLVAHINAAGLVQGVYQLKPVLTLPPNLGNPSVTPSTVKVTITK